LPTVERIMNSSEIPGTTHSPFELIYGSQASSIPTIKISDAITNTDSRIETITNNHTYKLNQHKDNITNSNNTNRTTTYEPGTRIMVLNPKKTKSFSSPRYTGPYTVLRQVGSTVHIADLVQSGIVRQVHVKRTKPLSDNFNNNIDLRQNYCEVESILSHRFTDHGTLVVRVKWTDQEDSTEENLLNNPSIRRTKPFYSYCTITAPQLIDYVRDIVIFSNTENAIVASG
jgi:hypothetical protein